MVAGTRMPATLFERVAAIAHIMSYFFHAITISLFTLMLPLFFSRRHASLMPSLRQRRFTAFPSFLLRHFDAAPYLRRHDFELELCRLIY